MRDAFSQVLGFLQKPFLVVVLARLGFAVSAILLVVDVAPAAPAGVKVFALAVIHRRLRDDIVFRHCRLVVIGGPGSRRANVSGTPTARGASHRRLSANDATVDVDGVVLSDVPRTHLDLILTNLERNLSPGISPPRPVECISLTDISRQPLGYRSVLGDDWCVFCSHGGV